MNSDFPISFRFELLENFFAGEVTKNYSPEKLQRDETGIILKLPDHARIRTTKPHVGYHFPEPKILFLELSILLHHPIVILRHVVQLVHELVILIPEPHDLRPELVQMSSCC